MEPRCVNCELIGRIDSDSELLARKVIIQPALRHQLIMRANLSDTPLLEHDDRMGFPNRAESMGDHDGCAASH